MTAGSPTADLAGLYREARQRVVGLVGTLRPAQLAAPVPACPGWSVADVVAHLTAVVEDALAGRLTGPPDDQQTAAQVARFRGRPIEDVVSTWTELAPRFEETIGAFAVWPAVMDVAAHEHDIRGAVSAPGARDADVVRLGAERLIAWLQTPVPMVVRVEDAEFPVRSQDGADKEEPMGQARQEREAGLAGKGAAPLVLDTTRFETLRWRLGRRSRSQLGAMAWTGDPAPVLDHLVVFGPSPEDIVE